MTALEFKGMCPLCVERGAKPNKIQVAFHFVTRRRTATRWDLINVIGACKACNKYERYYPDLSRAWFIRRYGSMPYLDLVDKSKAKVLMTEEGLEEIIRRYS